MTTGQHERTAVPFDLKELNDALRAAATLCLQKRKNLAKAAEQIATEGLTIELRGQPFTIRVRNFDQTLRELADELHIS